jgi:two-component system OmpR family sensor kinase
VHLRTKLTLGILTATVAVFAAVGYVAIPATKIALRDRIDARLLGDLPAVRDELIAPGGRIRPSALDSDAYAVVLIDRSGADVLAASGADDPPPELSRVDLPGAGEVDYAEAADGSKYRYATVQLADGRTLAVAAPVDDLRELVNHLIRTFSAFAIAGVALLALMSWWWIRHSTRPIERLTERAGEIARGDSDRTLSVPAGTAELRELARALDSMISRVDASLVARTESEARLREFVANASHELRTPLTSITGYLQLDHDGAFADDEHHRSSIGRALVEATRMRRIVADLQLLAELDEDPPPVTSEVDIAALVRDAIQDARTVDPTRSWNAASDDEPLLVRGDPDQLRQVIVNLLDNARVHTPPGTATTVSARSRAAEVVLEVSDGGPGVPEDELPRVFDRFWRHDRSRSRASGGSGLGLSIVAAIVTAHHGTIAAARASSGGLRIRIGLTRSGCTPPEGGEHTARPRAVTTSLHANRG